MIEAILSALLSLPGLPLADETKEAWNERARVIAQAIDSATLQATCSGPYRGADWCEPVWHGDRSTLAAILIVQGYFESRFAAHVQAGRCRRDECDAITLSGGRVFHRARSYWQLHASSLVPWNEWYRLAGVEFVPTADAAYAAARVVGLGLTRCETLEGAVAMFATGRSCRWTRAAQRVRMAQNVERGLREHRPDAFAAGQRAPAALSSALPNAEAERRARALPKALLVARSAARPSGRPALAEARCRRLDDSEGAGGGRRGSAHCGAP
jgi:hypothetical protein